MTTGSSRLLPPVVAARSALTGSACRPGAIAPFSQNLLQRGPVRAAPRARTRRGWLEVPEGPRAADQPLFCGGLAGREAAVVDVYAGDVALARGEAEEDGEDAEDDGREAQPMGA